ncbi:MAG TPA: extracellular solute-binding protein [Anaerolineae bacterium]|mgnify:CR=1 FL=1|nr:extracellular solute-binding protein [Anaerolineae bacterium]HQI87371.1 extracellular solute-binding protein [Anaerolineae bacterium]
MKIIRISLIGILLTVALGGCTWLPTSPATLPPTPTETLTPSPEPTPLPTPTPLPGMVTLTLWVPDFLNPYEDATGAAILHEQLAAFSVIQPDIQVQIIVKKSTGSGGLYNLLSAAYSAAPSVVPDLIILNPYDLQSAVKEGYIQPLSVTPLKAKEFFPFAWASGSYITTTYGIPLVIQADHMVYRQGISATPPFSWTDVLTGGYTLLFPAAPVDGLADDAVLAAYLGAGGAAVDENGRAKLDRQALEQLYRFFAELKSDNLINPERVLGFPNAAACWAAYQQGVGRLSAVPAGAYWSNPPEGSLPAWMPTPTGQPIAVGHVWSMALVSRDSFRQKAALKLLEWLTAPEQIADLTRATYLLPAQYDAIERWGLLPEETAFLQKLLESAVLSLPPTVDTAVRRALQAGLIALLKDDVKTPEEAASYALSALRP